MAEHADAWNGFTPVEEFAHKNRVLDEWCDRVGRKPAEIERTVLLDDDEVDQAEALLEAGATHLIVGLGFEHPSDEPFDLSSLERLLEIGSGKVNRG